MRQKVTYDRGEIREKFKDLFEYSLDLIYAHDLRGNFLDANDVALFTLGFKREEISDISFSKLIDKNQLEIAFNTLKEIKENGRQIEPSEYKLKNRHGNYIYLETYGIPLKKDGKVYGILGIGKDISAKKQARQKLKKANQDLEKLNLELESIVQKRTEKLKESEERFRSISEKSLVGICIIQNNVIKYANQRYAEIGGYTVDEMMNWKPGEFIKTIHPEDRDMVMEQSTRKQVGLEGAINQYQFRVLKKRGETIWVEILSNTILYKGKSAVLIMIIDIMEKKEAEEKLKESEELFRNVFETMTEGVIFINLDGQIVQANSAAEQILGLMRSSIEEHNYISPVWEILRPDGTSMPPNEMVGPRAMKEEQLVKDIIMGIKSPDKTICWINVSGAPLLDEDNKISGVVGTFSDITERRKAEQNLKDSEEKYRSILENINEGYFEVDIKGNFTFFNDALCESLGYSRQELKNMSYRKIFDEETKKRIFRVYNDLYEKGEGSDVIDYQVLRKDGKRIYHESSVYLRRDSNRDIIGFKGLVRDVTERKKAEALRKRFNQELEKEVKLRTKELQVALNHQKLYLDQIIKASNFKTEFLATMSHELRTPLNAIIGFTDLLLEGMYGQLNSEQLGFIKDIGESSKHLLDMISNILDISKIESGKVTLKNDEINLYDIIEQVISTLNPLYNKKCLKIEVKGLKKNQIIFVDRIKFKQIVYNLLSNAIKFTEKGTILFEFLDKKDNWEFNVKDTGIGIAKEDFEIIFKDFKRAKSSYIDLKPGSGLGLALTKRLVNLHGGDISFLSELGIGSTFRFFIPKKRY